MTYPPPSCKHTRSCILFQSGTEVPHSKNPPYRFTASPPIRSFALHLSRNFQHKNLKNLVKIPGLGYNIVHSPLITDP